ncbi:MAG TPA: hypothetical protein VL156_13875 [Terriglobales bacterium]|jgi:hypothetical protein|nr:hypothetical protein [Terriglobales bacterium]
MRKNAIQIGLLTVLLVTLSAAQQSSVQREGNTWTSVTTGSLSGVHNLHIKVEMGDVKVQGGQSQGINYAIRSRSFESSEERGRKQLDSYKISAYTKGDTAWIVGEWESGHPHKFSSEVTVNVPRDMESVKIETDGGQVVTTGISGRLEAESGGGNIHLDDIGGAIAAETGGGPIEIGNVRGDLAVSTGGGTIRIGSVKGKVAAESGGGNLVLMSADQEASLQTGGGSIRVDKCTGKVKASTGGGGIELGQIGGGATMETGGGSLKLGSASGLVSAETGSGSIELWGVPAAHVETGVGAITAKFIASTEKIDSELETGMGDITIYLMPNVNITVQASIEASNGHTITSDFPQIRVNSEGGQWGPKLVSAEGAVNGGGPVVKLRTTMGNIFIRRAQ